jgi:hypothetical protein
MKILLYALIFFNFNSKCSQDDIKEITCNNKGNIVALTKQCKCTEGFATFMNSPSHSQCNYELRSYYTAVCLSLFGGIFGADMYYLGHYIKGFLKSIFPISLFFLMIKIQTHFELEISVFKKYLIYFPFLIAFLLWLLDFFLILFNVMKDSAGFPLYVD